MKNSSRGDFFKVQPKNYGQEELISCIEECIYTLCYGPAGTGKTYISMALGFYYYFHHRYERLIFLRPIQECGKGLGFMPGNKSEKLDSHITTFKEIIKSLNIKEIDDLYRNGRITIDTLDYLRGRTFNNCYVVVDEAQNCTYSQLKMVLTRLGRDSKMILLGDYTQTDLLPRYWYEGQIPYKVVIDRLIDCDDKIGIIEMTEEDIIRNDLITKICKVL
ncbi:MAG: PhoH family protein [Endomicrobiia bacterium]